MAVDAKAHPNRCGNKLLVNASLGWECLRGLWGREEEGILIRVLVTGATGKMGRRVIDLVHTDPETGTRWGCHP